MDAHTSTAWPTTTSPTMSDSSLSSPVSPSESENTPYGSQCPFPSGPTSSTLSVPGQLNHPQGILIRREPVFRMTITVPEVPPSKDSESTACSPIESPSVSESPKLGILTETPMNSRASSLSSDSSTSSALSSLASSSSVCTRTTATTVPSPSLCVSFAPLPDLGPRVRKSKRPLGIAARAQILRQRRMALQAEHDGYYEEYDDDLRESIPGSGSRRRHSGRSHEEEVTVEDPIVLLGRALNDATKQLWRRIASTTKPRSDSLDSQTASPGTTGKRSFSLRMRKRADSTGPPVPYADDSDSDSDDEHWRRKNEDPMTKTIMEGDEHELNIGYEESVEEDVELTRAHDEIRSTVELHVVEPEDSNTYS